jgi:hypothetical protein
MIPCLTPPSHTHLWPLYGLLPPTTSFCTLTLPYPVTHPPNGSCYFEPNLFLYHFLFLVHSTHIYLPKKMEQTECSEMSAYKIQTPANYTKESIQHAEHGEGLKSRMVCIPHTPTKICLTLTTSPPKASLIRITLMPAYKTTKYHNT